MEYIKITEDMRKALRDKCDLSNLKGTSVKLSTVKDDLTYFGFMQIGLRPRTWQSELFKKIDDGFKRIMAVTPRQVGKSTGLALIALRASVYNMFPDEVYKRTTVGIISSTDDQSKKILDDIRQIMELGDTRVEKLTKGRVKNFFTNMIDMSPKASNTKTSITFKNGSKIICLPPTKKVRGYPFGLVLLDEAAFFEDDSIYYEVIEPTVRSTKGTIIMTSTPNGQHGFFYELFDPEDKYEDHEYERLWMHYNQLDDADDIAEIERKKTLMEQTGRIKEFQQEYEAKFTVDQSSFFDSDRINYGVDKTMVECVAYKDICHLGIDFGMTKCHTVLTISTQDTSGQIQLLYQYTFPLDSDDNLIIPMVEELKQRFNIQEIIVDDCPQGRSITQHMINKGWQINKFNFKSEKIEKYFSFRARLYTSRIKYYYIPELIGEMKSLQEIKNQVNTLIKKPQGGSDDRIDSFLISCYRYLDEGITFKSDTISTNEAQIKDSINDRGDTLWQNMIRNQEKQLQKMLQDRK